MVAKNKKECKNNLRFTYVFVIILIFLLIILVFKSNNFFF